MACCVILTLFLYNVMLLCVTVHIALVFLWCWGIPVLCAMLLILVGGVQHREPCLWCWLVDMWLYSHTIDGFLLDLLLCWALLCSLSIVAWVTSSHCVSSKKRQDQGGAAEWRLNLTLWGSLIGSWKHDKCVHHSHWEWTLGQSASALEGGTARGQWVTGSGASGDL